MSSLMGSADRGLVRSLTLIPAASVIIASVIGTGVFVKARVMTCNVGSPTLVLLAWLAAGLLSLAGAIVYAELAAMMPRAGGEFNFLGAAYGRRWAFVYGWTKTLAGGASTAAIAIMCVTFLDDAFGGTLSPVARRALPAVLIALAVMLNLASARANGGVATALTIVKIALVAGIGLGAFLLGRGTVEHLAPTWSSSASGYAGEGVPATAQGGVRGFGAAMLGALWAYNGWAVIAQLGGEVRSPGRTLPRALIGATVLVIALYLLVNAAYFYVMPAAEIAALPSSSSVAHGVASRFLGPAAASLIAVGLAISAYGSLHAGALTGARLPFALASRGLLPRPVARVSSGGTPVTAVLACGAWATILALGGTFDVLSDMSVFLVWIFFAMTAFAVFVLRRRHPHAHRPYRAWGYPVVPALFVIVTALLLVNTVVATPGRAVAAIVFLLSGVPVYAIATRRAPAAELEWIEHPVAT